MKKLCIILLCIPTFLFAQQGTILTNGSDACFRSHRFSPSYSGITSLPLLVPSTVIELNPFPKNYQIYISSCTDSLACNYDPLANVNDSVLYFNIL